MQRAWTFRRFVLPLAGVVCWAGLSVGAERLQPPRPPADNDGLELDSRNYSAPKPVLVEAAAPDYRIARVPEDLPTPAPNSSLAAEFDPHPLEPITLQSADPQPIIEQPIIEQPLTVYPDVLPQVLYAPSCQIAAPTCAGDIYLGTPDYDSGCGAETVCAGCCLPSWTFRAEAIIWDRAGGTNVPLVNAPVVLNTFDLDGGWRAGPRLTAIKHGVLDTCWDLEAVYFGINGWSGTQVLADADNYLTTPVIVIGGVTPLTATYSSSLQNGELNGRRAYSDWVTWIVGFRAIQIDESLTAVAGGASHSVRTQNRLYGGQIGADFSLFEGPCWQVNAIAKAGIYGNSADQVTRTAGVGGAVPFITFGDNQTCFVGEFGVNARRPLTERLTFMAGYNLLWVNGLALAPEQLATTNIVTGAGALSSNGNLLYHGVNIGLEYGW